MNVYDFTAKDQAGNDISLKQYEGKVLLIVNTATKCGFTPQYEELESLFEKYQDQGFIVLDFPCNQFFHQAPGSDEEINQFCAMKFNTKFPRFKKIDVNGKNADPLFVYLESQNEKGKVIRVKWNFTKFLIARDGTFLKRFGPTEKPSSFEDDIINALK